MRAPNYTHRVLTLTQAQTARSLYREGWGIGKLARHFRVSRQAIWSMLRKHGVELRGRHERLTAKVNVAKRDAAGINVTLRRQRDGAYFSIHVPGKRIDAIRHVANVLDTEKDVWRVVCYSTPETIAGDLARNARDEAPEVQALKMIDRLDLLDPSVRR